MPSPIFLYTGPEAGEKNDQIASQKQALKDKFGSSDDFVYYCGKELNMNEVIAQLMTESLFTPATFITVRNAELLKDKNDIENLADWAKSAETKNDGSAVLILVSDELKVDPKLEKIVPPANKKVFWEMFDDRKEQWLFNFFKKNGYSVEQDAVSLILEMVENNTEALRTECGRFFMCFAPGHCVTEKDVEQVLSHNREESAFTLFNEMTERNTPEKKFENCLSILQKIRLSKKDSESVVIIAGLTYCFRKLALWHNLHSNGKNPSETELKINGFSSKTAQNQYRKAAAVWNAPQTAAIEAILAKTDIETRNSGDFFQDTQLVLMIYEIIIKKGAYCSKYETAI